MTTDVAVRHELGDHLAQLTAAYLATLHPNTAKAALHRDN